jgi:hypothetical protein
VGISNEKMEIVQIGIVPDSETRIQSTVYVLAFNVAGARGHMLAFTPFLLISQAR